MSDWIYWSIVAGILVIVEIFTGTFYLLMIAIGFAAGAFSAWLGLAISLQIVIAAIVGTAATLALRFSRYGSSKKTDAARDPNVNIDIGQTVIVGEWQTKSESMYTARVMYRGAMWDIELSSGERAQPGVFTICALKGNRLVVTGATR